MAESELTLLLLRASWRTRACELRRLREAVPHTLVGWRYAPPGARTWRSFRAERKGAVLAKGEVLTLIAQGEGQRGW